MRATETEPLPAPALAPLPVDPTSTGNAPRTNLVGVQRRIAWAAAITSLGNLSSRVIGLAREMVKSFYFGNGQAASAFELAANIPTQFYDLLVGGMLSSALVPTLSGLAAQEDDEARRREFGALLGALIGLFTLGLSVLIAILWLCATPIAHLIGGGPNQDAELVASLLRITIPAILFLNLSGIVSAALFARHKFGFTAFTATIFNLTLIVCMALFESRLGVASLALGLLAGSAAQVLIQLPGLRGVPIRLSLNWRLPGVSRVIRLFLPVAGGLVLAQIAVQASFIFAGRISAEGPATMRYAAQVIQFPLGMIVTAVSAAILPSLSAARGEAFKATLAQGLRLVWVLIAPATVGLYVLATPVIALLFQHGAFTAESTAYTAVALRAAAPGLLFAAIDTPLIFAFYARRDTRTPTLVGLVSTTFYLVLIGGLAQASQAGMRPFTLADLILANSLKTGVDAMLMGFFLWREIGGLGGYGLAGLIAKVSLASLVMGGAVWLVMSALLTRFGLETLGTQALVAIGAALVGGVVYVLCASALRIPEWMAISSAVRQRLGVG
ncbi:MAG: murein biosynthesis integral membrane protein MurJ [Chloroflexi bacterium]|jgi:putative peptidoglycan lipid II flippase|uniref:Probable lipid II flippase MurJ n=1 Tax=Candidatus Thermofonsia Clade 3 bacterium TaxID=2364212 RepID=A0A2M8QH28_9CHLR|nr:murein biosynthesis integral membrane protein MurJ [Candidatus Roseilinea sp. NK_OTU-006]PJF49106.1 MAG: murein biosynthesis integral membrane protein MurJ [Candidatus Thermofonsia Clade 3 bacterium]RMG62759.1 MAG: murein biosynthesis integral membrane protein MurJ [Chloroflexota bacterium]